MAAPWATILHEYKDSFAPWRDSVNLKDKWRSMVERTKAHSQEGTSHSRILQRAKQGKGANAKKEHWRELMPEVQERVRKRQQPVSDSDGAASGSASGDDARGGASGDEDAEDTRSDTRSAAKNGTPDVVIPKGSFKHKKDILLQVKRGEIPIGTALILLGMEQQESEGKGHARMSRSSSSDAPPVSKKKTRHSKKQRKRRHRRSPSSSDSRSLSPSSPSSSDSERRRTARRHDRHRHRHSHRRRDPPRKRHGSRHRRRERASRSRERRIVRDATGIESDSSFASSSSSAARRGKKDRHIRGRSRTVSRSRSPGAARHHHRAAGLDALLARKRHAPHSMSLLPQQDRHPRRHHDETSFSESDGDSDSSSSGHPARRPKSHKRRSSITSASGHHDKHHGRQSPLGAHTRRRHSTERSRAPAELSLWVVNGAEQELVPVGDRVRLHSVHPDDSIDDLVLRSLDSFFLDMYTRGSVRIAGERFSSAQPHPSQTVASEGLRNGDQIVIESVRLRY